MLDSLFSQLADWAAKPRWAGTGFTRIVMELADLPGTPRAPLRAVTDRRRKMACRQVRREENCFAGSMCRHVALADRRLHNAHADPWRPALRRSRGRCREDARRRAAKRSIILTDAGQDIVDRIRN